MKWQFGLLVAATMVLNGCSTYVYRIVKPPGAPPAVAEQPVTIHYDPLEYQLSRSHDRLVMHITNPTTDRVALLGDRSFVVDPHGESHPIRGQVLGPHSFTRLSLPPAATLIPYPDYWGGVAFWGWPGWYDPFWGPYYGGAMAPSVSYSRIMTPFDWNWKEGPARVRLTYERNTNIFEHDFEFVRERPK